MKKILIIGVLFLHGWGYSATEPKNAEYLGLEGYIRFANEFYKGNLIEAFKNVSAVLDKQVFQHDYPANPTLVVCGISAENKEPCSIQSYPLWPHGFETPLIFKAPEGLKVALSAEEERLGEELTNIIRDIKEGVIDLSDFEGVIPIRPYESVFQP